MIVVSYGKIFVSSNDSSDLVNDTPPTQIPKCHFEMMLESFIEYECEY